MLPAIGCTIETAPIAYGVYELAVYAQGKFNDNPDCKEPEKVNDQNQQSPLVEPRKKPPVRTEPKNLEEQLALEEAKYKPTQDDDEIMNGKIKDPNFPPENWKKCEHIHEHPDGTNTDIHYWENRHTKERQDFKFKDY